MADPALAARVAALSLLSLALPLGACARKTSRATPTASASSAPPAPPSAAPAPRASPLPSDAGAGEGAPQDAAATRPAFDAGVNACRLTYGPIQQAWTGAAALVPTDAGLDLVTSKAGVPSFVHMSLPPAGAPRLGKVPLETEAARVSTTPCAVAGAFAFCMDAQGAVVRTPRAGGLGVVLGRSRPGTRVGAATLGEGHTVAVYLVELRKDEDRQLEAYASADDAPPVRISDEGSGATVVAVAPRGDGAIALLVDARTAMTPVHARALAWKDGKLEVGADAVVYVGGGGEPNTTSAIGTSAARGAFALIPIAGESGFGMASIHLGDPPAIDERSSWSPYPNGLDPAPLVATTGASPVRVARVRPVDGRPDSPKGVELGKLDDAGAFTAYGLISTVGRAYDLAVATDSTGTLWVYYTDSEGSWLQRRSCP